jgi:hypothetical protein
MKTTLCSALAFVTAAMPLLAQREVPDVPAPIKALIPPDSKILDAASADLNGDELADHVVVAEDGGDADAEDPTRTVFVIQQKAGGEFAIAARSDRAVLAKSSGGAMGDPFDGVSAKKKEFTLSHFGGRREKWTASYTFGYSRIDHAWQLIRVEGSRWSETAEMQRFKPPHDFGKIAFQDFDAEKWQGVGEGYRKSKLSQPKIPE